MALPAAADLSSAMATGPEVRFGDALEAAYWLYNRTGESWLLELTKEDSQQHAELDPPRVRSWRWHRTSPRDSARPGIYCLQGARRGSAARGRAEIMGRSWRLYSGVPRRRLRRGRVIKPGFTDPRQGFETLHGIVEFMHSFEDAEPRFRATPPGPTAAKTWRSIRSLPR